MRQYKPEYLGKVIPTNDPTKITDFAANKYESFSKIYDVCKGLSAKIDDIKIADSSIAGIFGIKISTDNETLENLSKEAKKNEEISLSGDVIMVVSK